jgi:hypothetical protein
MNTQYIITGIILLFALVYVIRKVADNFRKPKDTESVCGKFSGDCSACKAHFSSTQKRPDC